MGGQPVMLGAVACQALAGFLPWMRTGRRTRSSFELVDSARALDLLDSGVARGLAVAWYLVPLAAALCWLTALLDRRRTAAALAVGTGLLGVGFALSIEGADVSALVGVHLALIAAVTGLVGGVMELVDRRAT